MNTPEAKKAIIYQLVFVYIAGSMIVVAAYEALASNPQSWMFIFAAIIAYIGTIISTNALIKIVDQ